MKRFRDEQGIAMVTGLIVALVVLFLSLVVVNLSVHNTATSARDRDRTQAINAAEAGLDGWFSGLTSSSLRSFSLFELAKQRLQSSLKNHIF